MLTRVVKSAFRSASVDDYAPLSIVERISVGLRAFSCEQFITLICARIFPAVPLLEYVNAGHPPGIVCGMGAVPVFLEATGPLISPVFPDFSWRQETLRPGREDRLILFTDGILEAEGEQGHYGLERIVDEVKRSQHSGSALLDHILESVKRFSGGRPFHDDLTLLTMRLVGNDSG